MDYKIKLRRAIKGKAPCRSKLHKCIHHSDCREPDKCMYWKEFVKAMKNGK